MTLEIDCKIKYPNVFNGWLSLLVSVSILQVGLVVTPCHIILLATAVKGHQILIKAMWCIMGIYLLLSFSMFPDPLELSPLPLEFKDLTL